MRTLTTCLLLCGMAMADSGYAVLFGTVYGGTALPMPGVTVTLENPGLGVLRHTTTDDDGSWNFADVPPGKGYKVTAINKDGKVIDVRTGIDLAAGDERVVFPALKKTMQPFTQQELVDLMSGGVPNHRVALMVRLYGIAFTPTAEATTMLTQSGATEELLEALRYWEEKSHERIGFKYLSSNQCELAQKEFESLTSIDTVEGCRLSLADCFARQSKTAEARRLYTSMLAQSPDRSTVLRSYGHFLAHTGDLAHAIDEYRIIAPRHYFQDEASLALLLHLDGRLRDAVVEYRKIEYPWILSQLDSLIQGATAQQASEGEFRIAETALAEGRFAAAEDHYRMSLGAAPNFLAANRGLQTSLRAQNKIEAAAEVQSLINRLMLPFVEVDRWYGLLDHTALIDSYTEELKRNPRSIEAQLALGDLLGLSAPESARHFYSVLELDPENVEAHLELAARALARTAGDGISISEGIKHLADADRLKPDDASIQARIGWLILAQNQNDKGKWPIVEEHLRRAMRLGPDTPYYGGLLVDLFRITGDKASAREILNELSKHFPEDAGVHEDLAEFLEANSPERLAELRKAADLRPSASNLEHYAEASLAAHNYKEATDSLRQAIQIGTLTGENLSPLRVHLADGLEGTGDLDGGVALLEFVLKDNPIDRDALRRLGRLLRKQGRLDESSSILRDALLVEGQDADAHFELAQTLQQKKAIIEALTESKAATDIDPKNSDFQHLYASLRAVGPKPLTLADVEEGLKGGLSSKKLTALVKEFGVDFAATDEIDLRLRSQGADAGLLQTISQAKR